MKAFNYFLFVILLSHSWIALAQEFDVDKYPDHNKQVWLFPNKNEAKIFLASKQKDGWQGRIKQRLRMAPLQTLYFSSSIQKNTITELSEKLKKEKIPHKVVSYHERYTIELGQFYELPLLLSAQKKLYQSKIRPLQIKRAPARMTDLAVVELNKKASSTGLYQKTVEALKHQRYEFTLRNESAYNPNKPGAWNKVRNFIHATTFNRLKNSEWKISFRLIYDAVFDIEDTFSQKVEDEQKMNFIPEEVYWKYFDNNWLIQTGFINLKWGNLMDTYVADVASPKDLRDFILPRESSRDLPMLGLRFTLNFEPHNFEVLWLPVPSVDLPGRWGSPYYPVASSSYTPNSLIEAEPTSLSSEMGYGLRWHVTSAEDELGGSLFYLRSINREARFMRTLNSNLTATVQQQHFPITRVGGTFDFSYKKYRFHFEGVYNQGDKVPTSLATDIDGLVDRNNIHIGFQVKPHHLSQIDITLQYILKSYIEHTSDLMVDENEQFATIDIEKRFDSYRWLPKITAHFGTQRGDSLIRPRVKWIPLPQLNVTLGYDLFEGERTGPFGQFSQADRYYLETEYIF